MRHFKWYMKLFVFLLTFALLEAGMEFLFTCVDSNNALMFYDFEKYGDSEIIALGNSLSYTEVNPSVIEEKLGCSAFSLGVDAGRSDAYLALTKHVFSKYNPKLLLVTFDPYLKMLEQEDLSVQVKLSPFLSPINRIEYLLGTLQGDATDIGRFFPWTFYHPTSFADWKANLKNKLFPDARYKATVQRLNEAGQYYDHKGFVGQKGVRKKESEKTERKLMREDYTPFSEHMKKNLSEIKRICLKHDCKLVFVVPPYIRNILLADERQSNAMQAIEEFCREEQISLFNFAFAKEGLMEDLSPYYRDASSHLNMDGAQIYTEALCNVLQTYQASGDISQYFYSKDEWFASVDYISKAWCNVERRKGYIYFYGHALYGTTVQPEYRYTIVHEDGTESVLQDWSSNTKFSIEEQRAENCKIYLYVRNASQPSQNPIPYLCE